MQLPGMSTEPVRVRLEVTWWPATGDFSLARSVWCQSRPDDRWLLEGMEVSGSPIRLVDLSDRWSAAAEGTLDLMRSLHSADPFP